MTGGVIIYQEVFSMNNEPVVRFENVSKRFVFRPETPQSILETVISFFSSQHRAERDQDLWAVNDVSFEVLPGQALGIIGRNGSGKSTLLKLIARILRPNQGRIMINGRTSALLELGAGFHPDLTGRENIFLNAAVLGISKEDVAAHYDDIVAFSELGDYINMPVKHYSSGMYMRLGFSVAIHVMPDILIVDEILAVGDQAFQTKCIDRIYEMKNNGTTIIMVSHNLSMIRKLCSKLIWLENGVMRRVGPTEVVAGDYMAYSHEQEGHTLANRDASLGFRRAGSGEIVITAVRLLNAQGEETNTFQTNGIMIVEIDYLSHKPITDPNFSLSIFRQDDVFITGTNNLLGGLPIDQVEGTGTIRYIIDRIPLLSAKYQLTPAIYNNKTEHAYDYHEKAYSFRVVSGDSDEIHGFVKIPAKWEWEPTP